MPALFEQWVEKVLDAVQIRPEEKVLDVACGTGVLARNAIARVGSSGFVAGIDPDPGMLAVADRLSPTVAWRQGTAESLPYPDGSFDAVVSQFGLMFFTDRQKALQEMVRVLKPDGRLAVAVWNSLEDIPAYATEVALLGRMAGADAANAVQAPFVLGARDNLLALFEDAGVTAVEIVTQTGTARFPGVGTMVEADLRGWLPVLGVVLDEQQIQRILAEAESALGAYVTTEGAAVFELSAHIIRGTKP